MLRNACILLGAAVLLAAPVFAQDDFMGNWEGKLTDKAWAGTRVSAKIIAMRPPVYRAVVEIPDGDGGKMRLEAIGKAAKKGLLFDKPADLGPKMGGVCNMRGKVAKGKFKGRFVGEGAPGGFEMRRVVITPPTLGATPPAGAVVLLDGGNLDAWHCTKTPWELVEGGAMEVRAGNIRSNREFGDCKMHIEFRTPLMPKASGQARGNSGVYVQGRYEVQVLDSFGLEVKDNECGGIYKKAVPAADACLPPLQWQTYDIAFKAPRFDASGAKTANARITVVHNGLVIHDDVELDGACGGGVSNDEAAMGPLMLQDHHNRVQYRNIWVVPM